MLDMSEQKICRGIFKCYLSHLIMVLRIIYSCFLFPETVGHSVEISIDSHAETHGILKINQIDYSAVNRRVT